MKDLRVLDAANKTCTQRLQTSRACSMKGRARRAIACHAWISAID